MNRIDICFQLEVLDDVQDQIDDYAAAIERYTAMLAVGTFEPWFTTWVQQRITISWEMIGRYLDMMIEM